MVKCLVVQGEGAGGGYSFEDTTGFLWPDELDLAVNTSAARTAIMTAADWEVLQDCSRRVDHDKPQIINTFGSL